MRERKKWNKIFSEYYKLHSLHYVCGLKFDIFFTLHSHRAVGNILDNLHGIAVDMGDELDRQNVQLKHINKSAAINEVRLNQTNDRLRQQLY